MNEVVFWNVVLDIYFCRCSYLVRYWNKQFKIVNKEATVIKAKNHQTWLFSNENTKEKIKMKYKHNKLAHCTVSLLILFSVAYGRFMQLGATATC